MPLPWLLGTVAIATAAYLLSDDDTEEREADERREASREASRQRRAHEAETKARQTATELQASKNIAQQFFQKYYGNVPHSIVSAQSKQSLKRSIEEQSQSNPDSLRKLTKKVSDAQITLNTLEQLMASLQSLKGEE